MLRIITGTAKGKKLKTLEGEATRPTSDRIKEAVFSAIQFDVENRRVLDLFAGSGQLGLEALSRGAQSAVFIDSAREAIDIVKENARTTGFFDKCRYLVSDWRNYIRKASSLGRDKFDLVFIDPPTFRPSNFTRISAESSSHILESRIMGVFPKASSMELQIIVYTSESVL